MQTISIMDRDPRFAARLARCLSQGQRDRRFVSLAGIAELESLANAIGQKPAALICGDISPAERANIGLPCLHLRNSPSLTELLGEAAGTIPADKGTENETNEEGPAPGLAALHEPGSAYVTDQQDSQGCRSVYRYSGLETISRELDELLEGCGSSTGSRHFRTVMFFAPVPCPDADRMWEKLLARYLDEGCRAAGLPLTQPHLLKSPSLLISEAPSAEAGLGALLLRLQYEDLNSGKIMPYLRPVSQGCLAVPPAGASEDVNEIPPALLVKAVSLFRDSLKDSAESTVLVLLTTGLSLRGIGALLPLCDELHTVSNLDSVNPLRWQQELGRLLEHLPAGKKHIEHWQEEVL